MGLTDALLLDPYPFEIWIAQRTDGQKGSGTLNDPYNGSTVAKFDARMKELPGSTLIHLGPGTFETNGYSDDLADPWQMRPGIRIVGSGMNSTTLKLIGSTAGAEYFAIGHRLTTGSPAVPNPMDFCEVSDLTIDCNLPGSGSVRCGAIRLMGNHVKVHRVRAINWGNSISPLDATKVCFVISVLTADRSAGTFEAVNAGIQTCVVETPLSNSAVSPVVLLHAGGNEGATGVNAEGYGRACYIRNCFVDATGLDLTADIRALSMGWCRAGIVEGNQIHNVRIGGPYQDKATSREIVVRNNSYRNVIRGPYWNLGLPNAPAARSVGLASGTDTDGTPIAIATLTNHDFVVGDRIKVDATGGAAEYKGAFIVKHVTGSSEFKYQMQDPPQSGPGSSPTCRKVPGVANMLVERNFIELAADATEGTFKTAIDVHDGKTDADTTLDTPEYVHTEAIVRENRIRYVDLKFDPTWTGRGVRVSGAKNVIVRDNIIEIGPANPLKNFRCGTVKYFNNKTPSGALIQGLNGVTNQKYSELETESEDALLMTLM